MIFRQGCAMRCAARLHGCSLISAKNTPFKAEIELERVSGSTGECSAQHPSIWEILKFWPKTVKKILMPFRQNGRPFRFWWNWYGRCRELFKAFISTPQWLFPGRVRCAAYLQGWRLISAKKTPFEAEMELERVSGGTGECPASVRKFPGTIIQGNIPETSREFPGIFPFRREFCWLLCMSK